MTRAPFDPEKMLGPIRVEPSAEVNTLAHAIIGAAMEVHRTLGPGLLEAKYQRALAIELRRRDIVFQIEAPVRILYKGEDLGDDRADFIIDRRIIVETKAVDSLMSIHEAQVLSYLKATRLGLGLLINFNVLMLKDGVRRIILSENL